MTTLNVGNLSQIESSNSLHTQLSKIHRAIEQALQKIDNSSVFVPRNYLLTLRWKEALLTFSVSSQDVSFGIFKLSDALKKLGLPDFQTIAMSAETDRTSLSNHLDDMSSDVLTIKGSEIRFRAQHVIKPAQPGQEHLNKWSNLSDDVSIVVTRLPENSEDRKAAEQSHLQDVLNRINGVSVDQDGNITFNV